MDRMMLPIWLMLYAMMMELRIYIAETIIASEMTSGTKSPYPMVIIVVHAQ
jgi:hypothetical protein